MIELKGDFIPYFRELNLKQLKQIESISTIYSCKVGDVIFMQGEFCQNWVIVFSGSLLCRVRDDSSIISETILLPGESFDFKSTIKDSVTTQSLEAIEECKILVIDILGLKKIAHKNPSTIALIKMQFNDDDAIIWDASLLKREKKVAEFSMLVKKSILWTILKTSPLLLLVLAVWFLKPGYTPYIIVLNIVITLISYLNSRLIYLEINREVAIKNEFHIKKIASTNLSIPLDKIESSGLIYKNWFYKLLKLGEISIKSTTDNIVLDGVYKPEMIIADIENFKFSKVNIDKAIEISSFKYLHCKKNGLFCIESTLERDQLSIFSFRKSFIYFLVRSFPPFIIFLVTSIGLYFLFNSIAVFLLNVPTIFISIWHFWDWVNDKYAFEGNKVIDIEKRPFWGKEERIVADILSVQSISKEQKHIFQILFNYGDIKVMTLGGEIIYPSINKPDKVIDNLYLVKKYYHSKNANREKQERQEEFINYTKYNQELTGK